MHWFLLVNPRSGTARPSADELAAAASARGLEVRVLGPGDDAAELAAKADADAIGVAGGDGTVSSVAAVAVERDLPFVCVPFGTRNHFERAGEHFTIELRSTHVRAAIDGEPVEVESPLEARIEPGRLRLLLPAGP